MCTQKIRILKMNNRYTIGKFGIISEVKKGFARVEFKDDDIVSNWLPMGVQRSLNDKASWPYEVQEHVFCMMDEHCEYGVILCAIYSDADEPDADEGAGKYRKLFSDGTFIEYDKNSHVLTANVQGKIKAIATGDIEATSDKNIKATATEDITADAQNIIATAVDKISANAVDIEAVASGDITATATGDITADAANIEATATATAKVTAPEIEATAATSAKVVAPLIELTGVVNITGATTITGALTASSIGTSGGGSISAGGNISAGGTISAAGDISTSGGDVKAQAYGLKTHKHTGVTVGAGTSGPPTP